MSQQQLSSLHHWRMRQVRVGPDLTIKEAAHEIDVLIVKLGQKQDRSSAKDLGLFMVGFIAGIVLCAFHGCTAIGHIPVEGWPVLAVYEHHVPHHEMRDRCVQYAGFGMSPEACAEFDLDRSRCDIWFSADFPPPAWMVEHERLHCSGVDHIGSTHMRDFLRTYKASR